MTRISPKTQFWLVTTTLIILHSFSSNTGCQGWIPTYTRRFGQPFRHDNHHYHRPSKITTTTTTTELLESITSSSHSLGTDEAAWKKEGERIILQAAVKAGAKSEMVTIDWKGGHVVVTVDGSAYIPAEVEPQQQQQQPAEEDDDDSIEPFLEGDDLEGKNMNDDGTDESADDDNDDDENLGVDVVAIARGINAAFEAEGEGSLGYSIAFHHSIEVTTPGASDELSGIMFESYRGFDVILEFKDAKTNKVKKVEGKLVERDDEITRINERGRIRKFKNELVQSVKLPKAMSEKTFANSSPNKQKKTKKPKKKKKK